MTQQESLMMPKFEALKTIVDNHEVPYKVLMKSGTNFSHFTTIVVSKMKPRGILC
jgi:hypothetical protein